MAEEAQHDPTATPTSTVRSYAMSRVRGRDTKPELVVRRLLNRMGYRFRLQAKELPGRPDIVFRPRQKAIFVHGCFWHRHGCQKTTTPKSNVAFWDAKFARNVERDSNAVNDLEAAGWGVMVVWECETVDEDGLVKRLQTFLGKRPAARPA